MILVQGGGDGRGGGHVLAEVITVYSVTLSSVSLLLCLNSVRLQAMHVQVFDRPDFRQLSELRNNSRCGDDGVRIKCHKDQVQLLLMFIFLIDKPFGSILSRESCNSLEIQVNL